MSKQWSSSNNKHKTSHLLPKPSELAQSVLCAVLAFVLASSMLVALPFAFGENNGGIVVANEENGSTGESAGSGIAGESADSGIAGESAGSGSAGEPASSNTTAEPNGSGSQDSNETSNEGLANDGEAIGSSEEPTGEGGELEDRELNALAEEEVATLSEEVVTLSGDEQFQLEVSVAAGEGFSIPASGSAQTDATNTWDIDWGDGTVSTGVVVTRNSSSSGAPKPEPYVDAGSYTITITPSSESPAHAWMNCFGFSSGVGGANNQANKNKVSKVFGPLTPNMTRTLEQQGPLGVPPNGEWSTLFYGCRNLTQGPAVSGWDEITSVGSSFANGMFENCSSLTTLPASFNLPQNLTQTSTLFANDMFKNCTSLNALPEGFNLPQELTYLSNFFAASLFEGCTSLAELPNDFNMPAQATIAGTYIANTLFKGCTSLNTLPAGFNIPPNITSVGQSFFKAIFMDCTSLTSLPEAFTFPVSLTTAGDYIGEQMLYNAGNSSFQIHDAFSIPAFEDVSVMGTEPFYEAFLLSSSAPMQERSAAEIIGECATPAEKTFAFGNDLNASVHWRDQPYLALNWGGMGLEPPFETFSLNISVPVDGTSFCLPTSGQLNNNYTKDYSWSVNWGDGTITFESGNQQDDLHNGIAHHYAVAGNYTITVAPTGAPDAWLGALGFLSAATGNANTNANKAMVTGVTGPLSPTMTRTSTQISSPDSTQPSYEWANMFFGCTNLSKTPAVSGWDEVTTTGDSFASRMFMGCTSLATTSNDFTLPQGITSAGASFTLRMFQGCTALTVLPNGFNLPQGIAEVKGDFASNMFTGCSSLVSLPEGFNLPQSATSVGNDFASSMFYKCGALAELPAGFDFPENINEIGNNFAFSMFRECSSLASLPQGFCFPQDITVAGDSFAMALFYECTSLTGLPEGFNLPQELTTVESYFASDIFNGCSSLAELPEGFNIPQDITSVGDYFAAAVVANCTSLTGLPEGFSLPTGLTSVGDYIAIEMFLNAGSSSFQFNDEFVIPVFENAANMGEDPYYEAFRLHENAPLQERSAASIINGCVTPGTNTYAFGDSVNTNAQWRDQPGIALNWGGLGLEHYFSFEVTVTEDNLGFLIPVSGNLGGRSTTKTNEWNITWGDGTSETKTVTQNSLHIGVPHNYAAAGSYIITLSPAGSTEAWMSAFGFMKTTKGSSLQYNKDKLTRVLGSLTPHMTRTTAQIEGSDPAPSYEWGNTFYGCSNLSLAPSLSGWEGVTTAGKSFADYMFYECTSLTELPEDFNLPQSLDTVDESFAAYMFSSCTSLTTLPEGFTMPQNISILPRYFAYRMFENAGGSEFQFNEAFMLPQIASATSMANGVFDKAFQLNASAPLQERTAAEIIGACATPATRTAAFGDGVNVSAHWQDQPDISVYWGGLVAQALLTIEINVDETFNEAVDFMVAITNTDTGGVCTKIVTLPAGAATSNFVMRLTEGNYTVATTLEGGTWRYNASSAATLEIIAENDTSVSLAVEQNSTQWLSKTGNVRNVMVQE